MDISVDRRALGKLGDWLYSECFKRTDLRAR